MQKVPFTSLKYGQTFQCVPGGLKRTIHFKHLDSTTIIKHDGETRKDDWYVRIFPDSPLWSKDVILTSRK
ncbi:hypothetical protein WAE58_21565 [Pedobacter panaciterrae]|uniref:Uncharacterized protein n=1 Tax=Pedobacter panaciterrae TaxID=363849 RepID=A0ABU8NT01_9SPHI